LTISVLRRAIFISILPAVAPVVASMAPAGLAF